MSEGRLGSLGHTLTKLWLISPERLWLTSIALQRRGHWRLAFAVKQLNTILYHNSLAPGANCCFGHHPRALQPRHRRQQQRRYRAQGENLAQRDAGRRAAGAAGGKAPTGPRPRLIVEDGVTIGTSALIIAPRGGSLRIGRGARIGAGAIVTSDVPARATVVSAPARVLLSDAAQPHAERARAEVGFPDRPAEPPSEDSPVGD